jgi:hypothetical protein
MRRSGAGRGGQEQGGDSASSAREHGSSFECFYLELFVFLLCFFLNYFYFWRTPHLKRITKLRDRECRREVMKLFITWHIASSCQISVWDTHFVHTSCKKIQSNRKGGNRKDMTGHQLCETVRDGVRTPWLNTVDWKKCPKQLIEKMHALFL